MGELDTRRHEDRRPSAALGHLSLFICVYHVPLKVRWMGSRWRSTTTYRQRAYPAYPRTFRGCSNRDSAALPYFLLRSVGGARREAQTALPVALANPARGGAGHPQTQGPTAKRSVKSTQSTYTPLRGSLMPPTSGGLGDGATTAEQQHQQQKQPGRSAKGTQGSTAAGPPTLNSSCSFAGAPQISTTLPYSICLFPLAVRGRRPKGTTNCTTGGRRLLREAETALPVSRGEPCPWGSSTPADTRTDGQAQRKVNLVYLIASRIPPGRAGCPEECAATPLTTQQS